LLENLDQVGLAKVAQHHGLRLQVSGDVGDADFILPFLSAPCLRPRKLVTIGNDALSDDGCMNRLLRTQQICIARATIHKQRIAAWHFLESDFPGMNIRCGSSEFWVAAQWLGGVDEHK
jgi:hypothetical protein